MLWFISNKTICELVEFWWDRYIDSESLCVYWKTNEWMKTFFWIEGSLEVKVLLVLQSQLTTDIKNYVDYTNEDWQLWTFGRAHLHSEYTQFHQRVKIWVLTFMISLGLLALWEMLHTAWALWCNLCLLPFAPSRIYKETRSSQAHDMLLHLPRGA